MTDVYGRLGPRQELHHVSLTIDAREHGPKTIITGTIVGYSRIGEKCRLVNRLASRAISSGLTDALRTIECGGYDLYHSADSTIEALTRRGR